MQDFLILVGDSSDNLKGISGMGIKRAGIFLNKWGSIFNFIKNLFSGDRCKNITNIEKMVLRDIRKIFFLRRMILLNDNLKFSNKLLRDNFINSLDIILEFLKKNNYDNLIHIETECTYR